MAYTAVLNAANPVDSEALSVGASRIRELTLALQERLDSVFVDSDADPLVLRAETVGTTQIIDASITGAKIAAATIPQSAVIDLTGDLAGKAATSHTHAASDITSGTLASARLPTTIDTNVTAVRAVVVGGAAGQMTVNISNSASSFITVDASGAQAFSAIAPVGATDLWLNVVYNSVEYRIAMQRVT